MTLANGTVGWGETVLHYASLGTVADAAVAKVMGKPAGKLALRLGKQICDLHTRMRLFMFLGVYDLLLPMFAAKHMWDDDLGGGLQIALFDAVGKANAVPVSALLGRARCREWVPISWWSIDAPPEDWAEEAAEAVEHGYTTMKLKPRPWFDIVEQVRC